MQTLKRVLTIDPGWSTGLAYWIGDLEPITDIIKEPAKRKKIQSEVLRLKYMLSKFEAYIKAKEPDEAIIEGVELWSGSVRSMASATKGDTFTLAYLVGGYMKICIDYGVDVRLVYPRGDKKRGKEAWKGQMNADMIAKRIHRINGVTYPEHIREAVGIGFHKMGML